MMKETHTECACVCVCVPSFGRMCMSVIALHPLFDSVKISVIHLASGKNLSLFKYSFASRQPSPENGSNPAKASRIQQ